MIHTTHNATYTHNTHTTHTHNTHTHAHTHTRTHTHTYLSPLIYLFLKVPQLVSHTRINNHHKHSYILISDTVPVLISHSPIPTPDSFAVVSYRTLHAASEPLSSHQSLELSPEGREVSSIISIVCASILFSSL